MNIVKLFAHVPLKNLPEVACHLGDCELASMSLEEIRSDPDSYYEFIRMVVSKFIK